MRRAFSGATRTGMLLGVSFAAWIGAACAAEWSVEPSVSLREEHNDNIQMTILPHGSTWETFLTPAITLGRKTEVDAILLSARLNARHYSGDLDLTRNDQYYTLSGSTRSERNQWGMGASMTRDAGITAYSSSGETKVQRDYITLSPSWIFLVDENNQFKLNYQYAKANYFNVGETSLTDYSNQNLSSSWQYQLDERSKANAVVYVSGYETATGSYKANTSGIQAGINRDFSENLSGSFLFGMRTTKTSRLGLMCVGGFEFLPGVFSCDLPKYFRIPAVGAWQLVSLEDTGTGSTLTASLDYNTEIFSIGGKLAREINPSGAGYLTESDRIQLDASNKLTPNLVASLNLQIQGDRNLGDVSAGNDRHYYKIEPKVNWRMTEWWTLEAGYSHASQKYRAAEKSAKANVVFVNLTYNWPKTSVSR